MNKRLNVSLSTKIWIRTMGLIVIALAITIVLIFVQLSRYTTNFTEETDTLLFDLMMGLSVVVLIILGISTIAVKWFISDVIKPINKTVDDIRLHARELEEANIEIQALYEEMLASEEMLQYNYHELDRYKKALEEEKENYRKILIASNEVYWQYDVRSNEITITNFGKDMKRITSTFEEFLHKVYPEDRPRFEALFGTNRAYQATVFELKVRLLIDNAEAVYHWYQILTIHEGEFLFGSMTDIHSGRFAIWMKCDDLSRCASDKIMKLEQALKTNGGRFYNIEITETTISEYLDIVLESLNRLTENGFEVHMDDFGTGYSSLYQLGKMPIKVLKIDKSFVWAIETDPKMRALTKLIIDISHRLDMKIIAEGVETQMQYSLLSEMGCDYYQGYLFSKPLQASEI